MWLHGRMQYNKAYETLCGILTVIEEDPCPRSFLTPLRFRNIQKPVLVWAVYYNEKVMYSGGRSLKQFFDPSLPCILAMHTESRASHIF